MSEGHDPASEAPAFVIPPRVPTGVNIDVNRLLSQGRLTPEVMTQLGRLLDTMAAANADAGGVPICLNHDSCPALTGCGTYDAHGHGCSVLASCGTYSAVIEPEFKPE